MTLTGWQSQRSKTANAVLDGAGPGWWRLAAWPSSSPLVAIPPAEGCAVSVVIPARDEADTIAGTIAALAEQIDLAGRPLPRAPYEIILLANNCRDDTASIARRLADTYGELVLHVVELELPADEAHVGSARRLGMDEACRRLFVTGRPRGLIATTDADTKVSPTWNAATVRETERGAEAVGGRILVEARERQAMGRQLRSRFLRNIGYHALADEIDAYIDPRPADPWPRHHQFSGASLAITAGAYRRVGGLPVLASDEDVALGRALRRSDIEIRHSPDVGVFTSSRLDGRAPAGMADQLAAWSALTGDDAGRPVPGAATVVARATTRRDLRDQWQRARTGRSPCARAVARLAETIGVPERTLHDLLLTPTPFGMLLEEVETRATWPTEDDPIDVRAAITDLRAWLGPRRRRGVPVPFARQLSALPAVQPRPAGAGAWARTSRSSPLPTLEDIQTIRPFAPPPQVAQCGPIALADPFEERRMDGVTGDRVLGDVDRPVHQQQVAAGDQVLDDPVT